VTTPDAPSERVALAPMGQRATRCITSKEHKFLSGGELSRLRKPGTLEPLLQVQDYIAREQLALDRRNAVLREQCLGMMFRGSLSLTGRTTSVNVTYGVPAANTPTINSTWANATGGGTDGKAWSDKTANIVADIKALKRLSIRASGWRIEHAWISEQMSSLMMQNQTVQPYLGMADAIAVIGKEGYIQRFMGINWHVYDDGWLNSAGTFVPFVQDTEVLFTPEPDPNWMGTFEGRTEVPAGDEKSLVEVGGKYSYSTIEKDPAGFKLIVGDTFMPALFVPGAVVRPTVVF
jgi:hypothetical protein